MLNDEEVQTTNTPGKKDQNATTIMVSNGDHEDRLTNRKGAGSSTSFGGSSQAISIGLYASNTNLPSLGSGSIELGPALSEFPWGGGNELTAGAMAEKCVSGESKNLYSNKKEKITESALQLSVFAGASVQLNLNRHISIYAEPLATYYIDNHSDIINIYKDRKLNLDLRVGLRYTLK